MSLQTAIVAMGLMVGGADPAPADVRAPITETEKTFIDELAAADMAQMELGRLVRTRSGAPAVRKLAKTIADEDAANYHNLFKLCLTKTYAIAPQLDERHRQILLKLRETHSKRVFDRTYIDAVLVDQSELSRKLEGIAADAQDNEIAQFAADTLTMVHRHEHMARELAAGSRG